MVNSKKMSKSSIAVIVLAILLVLSMVLGLTGAWYTQKLENNGGGDGNDLTLRNDWISFTASGANGGLKVKRAVGEAEEATEIDPEDDGGYIVMPGDVVTASGSVKFAVTYTGDNVGFYYVLVKDGKAVTNTATHVGNGETEIVAAADSIEVSGDNILTGDSGSWVIDTNLTSDDAAAAGKSVTISFGSYSIYAIQDENVEGATGAYAKLKAEFNFADPAVQD